MAATLILNLPSVKILSESYHWLLRYKPLKVRDHGISYLGDRQVFTTTRLGRQIKLKSRPSSLMHARLYIQALYSVGYYTALNWH